MTLHRKCTACGEAKDLSEFAPRSDQPGKYRSHCRACVNNQNLVRYHKRPHTRAAHTSAGRRHALKKYGLTPEDYAALCAQQGNACAICGAEAGDRNLAVDHDHETGMVRGLLCLLCNTGLGKFQDCIDILNKAAAYLEKSNERA